MALTWHGDRIIRRMDQAQRKGLQVTMGVAVRKAKQRVRVDTSRLQRSLQVIGLQKRRHMWIGTWGSPDVSYAAAQEYGPSPGNPRQWAYTPYLRPSAQEEYPKLPARIKAAFERRSMPA